MDKHNNICLMKKFQKIYSILKIKRNSYEKFKAKSNIL